MSLRSMNDLQKATRIDVPVDIRGWDVWTALDARKVGTVHDVLVDSRGTARYADVDLGMLRKHVILPIGQAQADELQDVVWVQGLDPESLDGLPPYEHDPSGVTPEFEDQLAAKLGTAARGFRYDRPEYGGRPAGSASLTAGAADAQDPTVLGTEHVRLRRLSELEDYEVADHDPDPRGWSLVGAHGERIGGVDDLIVDPQALTTRYLEVQLERDVVSDRDARRALVPVGFARLNEDEHEVKVAALDEQQLDVLPRFRDAFDEAYEDRLDQHFESRFRGATLYGHPRFEAERLYRARTTPADRAGADRICDLRLRR